jgi:hypothetical protein
MQVSGMPCIGTNGKWALNRQYEPDLWLEVFIHHGDKSIRRTE